MAIPILVYGKSGSGKSRSLKEFGEDEITLINVISKDMPFRKKFKYEIRTRSYETIAQALQKMPTDIAVIDDAGYLQTSEFMTGHSKPKNGSSTFDLFNKIGDDVWNMILFIKDKVSANKRVYMMMHELTNDYGETKVRTLGKLLDEKVCLEGMMTICLRCMTDGKRHYFKTQGGTSDIAKAPEEMFENDEIPNDLKYVDDCIKDFYGFGGGQNG